VTEYDYDAQGRLETITYFDSLGVQTSVCQLSYDVDGDNNALKSVQIPGVAAVTIADYMWNRPAKMMFPGGTQRMYGYDALENDKD
jgi:hypothetical protein